MLRIIRPRLIRVVGICMLAFPVLLVGCYGDLLLIGALNKNGSAEGNSLLFSAGLILLILSAAMLAVIGCQLNWSTQHLISS
jgi:hypothetical protein